MGVPSDGVAAKNGTQGPTVKSTDPDTATVDSTLNVRVFGSGFDDGSRADWAFKGVVSEKIRTNSTIFVSSTELVANITIASNANIGSHDVIVTTKTGKPGIGTELFEVIMKMTMLPTLGGPGAEAHAVNDAGDVVGSSTDTSRSRKSFAVRWRNVGGVWTVKKLGEDAVPYGSSVAFAINEAGTAVGTERDNAIVWRADGSKKIIAQVSSANAINNFDVIVGWAALPGVPGTTPVVWTPSGVEWTLQALQRLPGVTQVTCRRDEPHGIGDGGIIVGFVYDDACVQTPVMWRPAADGSGWLPAERLSPPGSLASGLAQDISGSVIVGTGYPCAVLNGCKRKAFRWTPSGASGEISSLDARANGVNRAGDIVGSYIVKSGRMTGFVWSPATSSFVVLPSLNGTGDNWAWDINDAHPRQAVGAVRVNSTGWFIGAIWTIP
jgi:uncharacterized membrane protein